MRMLSIALNAVFNGLLAAGLLCLLAVAFAATLPYRLYRWAELHAVYDGDTQTRDKADWRAS